MKKIITTIASILMIISVNAQIQQLAGPRIGMTFITSGSTADFLHEGFSYVDEEKQPLGETGDAFTTQYGWQWESRFADGGGDVVGIVEWVALVAGMEQGKFLPSLTSVIGARTSSGLEFGVGPSLSLSGVGMVFAIGKNFKSGSLNLPVNLVFMPGKEVQSSWYNEVDQSYTEYSYNSGARISLMVGFNLNK